jgi:NDP-sugar pyrophosphorylase family protein
MIFDIPKGVEVSLEKNLVPRWLAEGKLIVTMLEQATCIDIGTPERYWDAQTVLAAAEENADSAPSRVPRD